MTVTQFDPFTRLDRVFDRLLTGDGGRGTRRMSIPMDVYRRGNEYIVELDLPGVSPDAIDITVERNVISVRAERGSTHEDVDEVLVCERPHMTFERQIYVSDNLDTDRMQAQYENGVLVLRVPLSEASQPRHISVSGSSQRTEVSASGSSGDMSAGASAGSDQGGSASS